MADDGSFADGSSSDGGDLDEDLETLSWDGMDDRDCFTTMKTVCDVFAASESAANNYYFYRVEAVLPEQYASEGCGSSKDELDQCLIALNGLGFVLKSPIPEDVLLTESDLFLSDAKMIMTIHHIGTLPAIPCEDLVQMQRFHRAVCCMEDVNASRFDDYLNMENDFSEGREEFDPTTLVESSDWVRSSNGAWFVVFPVDSSVSEALLSSLSSSSSGKACYDSGYLKRSADEAQVLLHNLRVVGGAATSKPCRLPTEASCAQYHQDAWKDLILLANGISLCCAAADTPHNRRTLGDVMKSVKFTPPPPLPAPEFVVVPARQEGAVVPFPAPLVVMRSADAGPIPVKRTNFSEKIDITYADYFKAKRPHLISAIERYQQDLSHRLLAANQISTKTAHTLLLTPICEDVRGNPDWIKRNSVHNMRVERLHFLAEQCRPLGRQKWFFASRLVPSVMHRIQSWHLAHEARALMTARIEALEPAPSPATISPAEAGKGSPSPVLDSDADLSMSANAEEKQMASELSGVRLDCASPSPAIPATAPHKRDLRFTPSLKLMLEALTPRMVAESFDSER